MKKARLFLDITMTLALPCLMAYELIGQATHEILGLCTVLLFLLHHALNWKWHRNLFKGKYTPYRIALTVIDVLMIVIFISQAVCGILMAKHIFPNLPHVGRRSIVRVLHLLGAYWGFTLVCLHGGMHMTGLLRKGQALKGIRKTISTVVVAGISVYGIAAFIRRGWFRYMTLQEQFVFFDFDEPLIAFFADVIAMLVLLMTIGCLAGYGLQRIGWRKKHEGTADQRKPA